MTCPAVALRENPVLTEGFVQVFRRLLGSCVPQTSNASVMRGWHLVSSAVEVTTLKFPPASKLRRSVEPWWWEQDHLLFLTAQPAASRGGKTPGQKIMVSAKRIPPQCGLSAWGGRNHRAGRLPDCLWCLYWWNPKSLPLVRVILSVADGWAGCEGASNVFPCVREGGHILPSRWLSSASFLCNAGNCQSWQYRYVLRSTKSVFFMYFYTTRQQNFSHLKIKIEKLIMEFLKAEAKGVQLKQQIAVGLWCSAFLTAGKSLTYSAIFTRQNIHFAKTYDESLSKLGPFIVEKPQGEGSHLCI